MMKSIMKNLFLILAAVFITAGCVSAPPEPARVGVMFGSGEITIGFVSPRILTLTVTCGKAVAGKQVPYVPEPGDQVRAEEVSTSVFRDGKCYGFLAGRDRKIIYLADRFIPSPFKPESGMERARYLVSPDSESAFARGLVPSNVYRKSRPVGIARTAGWAFQSPVQHTYYLLFPTPFSPGARYTLTCPYGLFPSLSFAFEPEKSFSEAVHVSQVGFRPDDPSKTAFLSCWTGSGGGLAYEEGLGFRVLDERTGAPVFNGKTAIARRASEPEDGYERNYSGTDVYEMDFSGLTTKGTYRVFVDGVGCSFPFRIGPDAWKEAFTVSARGFYHQRSGIELGPPFTTYRRPRPFNPRDGLRVLASRTGLMETGNGLNTTDSNFGNLVKGATEDTVPDAWGGYMDAGDWDRRIQHLEVTRLLFDLYEMFPAYYAKLSLNIPESANTLPDVLDEALFNLDCYRRMQTPEGGIRGGIESEEHPRHGEASWQESLRVFAYAPDPWSSYIYAGTAAHCGRILASVDKTLAAGYAASAVKAYEWAEKKTSEVKYDAMYAFPLRDARNLAAADLFRLTGEERYNAAFKATTVFTKTGQDLFVWRDHEQRHAAWVYANAGRPSADRAIAGFCRDALVKEADERLASTKKAGFRWAKFAWNPPAWGAFGAPDGVTLARVHALTGDPKYLAALLDACQHGAGANPLNLCYTTGVGQRWPQNPLHVDSRISGQDPPPGLTVFGPVDYSVARDGLSPWLDIITGAVYPPIGGWPGLESYWDVYWYPAECEYTVQDPMARNAFVWGYLAAR
jgi:endoglucanase